MKSSRRIRQEWEQPHLTSHKKDKSQGAGDHVQGSGEDDTASSPIDKKNGAAPSTFKKEGEPSTKPPGDETVHKKMQEQFKAEADKSPEEFNKFINDTFNGGKENIGFISKAEVHKLQQEIRNPALGEKGGTWPPEVQLGDTKDFDGAFVGGENGEKGQILLNKNLNPEQMANTYWEELGHAIDKRIRPKGGDAQGDEGAIFAKSLDAKSQGGQLATAELNALRAENDHGTISLDGQQTQAEFKAKSFPPDAFANSPAEFVADLIDRSKTDVFPNYQVGTMNDYFGAGLPGDPSGTKTNTPRENEILAAMSAKHGYAEWETFDEPKNIPSFRGSNLGTELARYNMRSADSASGGASEIHNADMANLLSTRLLGPEGNDIEAMGHSAQQFYLDNWILPNKGIEKDIVTSMGGVSKAVQNARAMPGNEPGTIEGGPLIKFFDTVAAAAENPDGTAGTAGRNLQAAGVDDVTFVALGLAGAFAATQFGIGQNIEPNEGGQVFQPGDDAASDADSTASIGSDIDPSDPAEGTLEAQVEAHLPHLGPGSVAIASQVNSLGAGQAPGTDGPIFFIPYGADGFGLEHTLTGSTAAGTTGHASQFATHHVEQDQIAQVVMDSLTPENFLGVGSSDAGVFSATAPDGHQFQISIGLQTNGGISGSINTAVAGTNLKPKPPENNSIWHDFMYGQIGRGNGEFGDEGYWTGAGNYKPTRDPSNYK